MTTLRTYLRETEALLAKSRLEAFEIPCALADENAHLYGGAPFAMPIRILVPDEFVEEAGRILDAADDDAVAAAEAAAPAVDSELSPMSVAKSNPWQILVVALVFFGPGFALLLQKRPMVLIFGGARRNRPLLTPGEVHLLGITLIAVALIVVIFYFRLCRVIRREAENDPARL
jgi:hypothetical protein